MTTLEKAVALAAFRRLLDGATLPAHLESVADTEPGRSRAALRQRLAAMRAELIAALAMQNAIDPGVLTSLGNVQMALLSLDAVETE